MPGQLRSVADLTADEIAEMTRMLMAARGATVQDAEDAFQDAAEALWGRLRRGTLALDRPVNGLLIQTAKWKLSNGGLRRRHETSLDGLLVEAGDRGLMNARQFQPLRGSDAPKKKKRSCGRWAPADAAQIIVRWKESHDGAWPRWAEFVTDDALPGQATVGRLFGSVVPSKYVPAVEATLAHA